MPRLRPIPRLACAARTPDRQRRTRPFRLPRRPPRLSRARLKPPSLRRLAPLNAAVKAVLEARAQPIATPGRARSTTTATRSPPFTPRAAMRPLWSKDGKPNPEVKSAVARLDRAGDDGLNSKNFPPGPLRPGTNEDDRRRRRRAERCRRRLWPSSERSRDRAAADFAADRRKAGPRRPRDHSRARLERGRGGRRGASRTSIRRRTAMSRFAASLLNCAANAAPPFAPRRSRRDRCCASACAIRACRSSAPGSASTAAPPRPRRISSTTRGSPRRSRISRRPTACRPRACSTPRTIDVLSGGQPSRLEAEIIANMERWRWMPRDLGARRIEVNIPDFEVVVVEGGRVVQRNRVVVGKDETPTPVFSNAMQFLIVNPAWNVPQSIIKKEMIGKLGYLSQHGLSGIVERRPDHRPSAAGRTERARPDQIHVPERLLRLSARHALARLVRRGESGRSATAACGSTNRSASRRACSGRSGAKARLKGLIGGKERYVHLQASAADPYRIFHRLRRRLRPAAIARRSLWLFAPGEGGAGARRVGPTDRVRRARRRDDSTTIHGGVFHTVSSRKPASARAKSRGFNTALVQTGRSSAAPRMPTTAELAARIAVQNGRNRFIIKGLGIVLSIRLIQSDRNML